jgi:hypothetical protein
MQSFSFLLEGVEEGIKGAGDVDGLEVDVGLLEGRCRVANQGQQFVCGDAGCNSGVTEVRFSRQFFHALG